MIRLPSTKLLPKSITAKTQTYPGKVILHTLPKDKLMINLKYKRQFYIKGSWGQLYFARLVDHPKGLMLHGTQLVVSFAALKDWHVFG